MTTVNQERKAIAAVACPTCGAKRGRPCRMLGTRPITCSARREAWREVRDQQPVDYVLSPHIDGPAGQRTHYMLVAPQSERALDHLRSMNLATAHGWTWVAGALRVPHADMRDLSRRIIADGWRTGERPT